MKQNLKHGNIEPYSVWSAQRWIDMLLPGCCPSKRPCLRHEYPTIWSYDTIQRKISYHQRFKKNGTESWGDKNCYFYHHPKNGRSYRYLIEKNSGRRRLHPNFRNLLRRRGVRLIQIEAVTEPTKISYYAKH